MDEASSMHQITLTDKGIKHISYSLILQQLLPNDRRLSMLQNSEIESNEVYASILNKISALNLQNNLIRQLPSSFSKLFTSLKELNI